MCSREDQRLRARIQQVIATAEANYKNKLWPLHCPVAELPLARKQNVNSYQSCSNEDHPNILQVARKSILTYLSPREMYNTAFLSRELMMCISVESVIVSAVMSGEKAAQRSERSPERSERSPERSERSLSDLSDRLSDLSDPLSDLSDLLSDLSDL